MDTNFKEIRTDRLVLKVLGGSYSQKVLEYFNRNKSFLMEWEPIRNDIFYTSDFQKIQLLKDLNSIKSGRMYKFWIFKKEDNDCSRIIGSIAFNNIVRGCFQSCHLGYRLDKDEINKGYMTEGLRGALNFAFNELNLHRIEANIMPKNKPSMCVVKKLGFSNEGVAKQYLFINGKWEDHIHMVLLNEKM
jgi:ribosomal-protein-alanine N-acetyltransferase